MANSNHDRIRTICELFLRRGLKVENRHFVYSILIVYASRGMPSSINRYKSTLTTGLQIILSLLIRVYLHSFSSCCLSNLQNPTKFSDNSDL